MLAHVDDSLDVARLSSVDKAWICAVTDRVLWRDFCRLFYRRDVSADGFTFKDAWLRDMLVASSSPTPALVARLSNEKGARDASAAGMERHPRSLFQQRLTLDDRLLEDLKHYTTLEHGRLSAMADLVIRFEGRATICSQRWLLLNASLTILRGLSSGPTGTRVPLRST